MYLGLASEALFKCVCAVGFAGDGFVCGDDSDLDGWPNHQLPCKQNATYHCQKVGQTVDLIGWQVFSVHQAYGAVIMAAGQLPNDS